MTSLRPLLRHFPRIRPQTLWFPNPPIEMLQVMGNRVLAPSALGTTPSPPNHPLPLENKDIRNIQRALGSRLFKSEDVPGYTSGGPFVTYGDIVSYNIRSRMVMVYYTTGVFLLTYKPWR